MPVSIDERAARLLQTLPPAIQGSGGSAQAQSACFKLVQGLAMEPEAAAAAFALHYNPRCIPLFTDAEITRKCNDSLKATPKDGRGFLLANQTGSRSDYVAPAKPLPKPAAPPKRKLFVTGERPPTVSECEEIADSRGLLGPGVIVAARLGVVRVAEFAGHRVYGIGDANGPLAAIRRIDGKPFPGRNGSEPAKSITLVSGAAFHRPYGYVKAPGIAGVALGEGIPDLLALWEQAVWESDMDLDPIRDGQPDAADYIRKRLRWVPLAMLSAHSRLESDSSHVGDFRGYSVLLVPHTDEVGIAKARGWFDAIKRVAKRVSVFDCSKQKPGESGHDFNDVFDSVTEGIFKV